MKRFQDPAVKKVFDSYPKAHRVPLLEVRDMIFDVAEATNGVGRISETLKWGEPSYLTEETGSGTTVRLGRFGQDKIAVYVHCQTTLVSMFRDIFPDLEYSKNRAVVLAPDEELPVAELRICIEMALTYKLKNKGWPRSKPRRERELL